MGFGNLYNRQPTWFVDGQNTTTLASDSNSGIDATHPLASLGAFTRRLGRRPRLQQSTTLTIISPPSDAGVIELVELAGGATFTMQGTWSVLHSGTLTGYTAPVFSVVGSVATNTQEKISDSAIASFSSYVGKILKITSGPNANNAYFFIDEDASSGGIGSAYITSPFNHNTFGTVSLSGTETYQILDQSATKLALFSSEANGSFFILQDLVLDGAQSPTFHGNNLFAQRCIVTSGGTLELTSTTNAQLANCLARSVGMEMAIGTFYAGGLVATSGSQSSSFINDSRMYADNHTKLKYAQLRVHSDARLHIFKMQMWGQDVHFPMQIEEKSAASVNAVGHPGAALWGVTAVDPVGCIQASGFSYDAGAVMSIVGPSGLARQIELAGNGLGAIAMPFSSAPFSTPGGCNLDIYPHP